MFINDILPAIFILPAFFRLNKGPTDSMRTTGINPQFREELEGQDHIRIKIKGSLLRLIGTIRGY